MNSLDIFNVRDLSQALAQIHLTTDLLPNGQTRGSTFTLNPRQKQRHEHNQYIKLEAAFARLLGIPYSHRTRVAAPGADVTVRARPRSDQRNLDCHLLFGAQRSTLGCPGVLRSFYAESEFGILPSFPVGACLRA